MNSATTAASSGATVSAASAGVSNDMPISFFSSGCGIDAARRCAGQQIVESEAVRAAGALLRMKQPGRSREQELRIGAGELGGPLPHEIPAVDAAQFSPERGEMFS